ncbi:MAG: ABC transporter permease [Candidatus Brocadiia bacterium]|jgi:ABC-type lipoprotein release transport system permease subunit
MKQALTISGLVRRNLRYYWRTNLAVALGCAIAVAALVGSLLVGDSVRGSLHDLAIERLGRVEYAVESPAFFREQLAADLLAQPQAKGAADFAVPAILAVGAVKPAEGGAVVNRVNVIGVPPEFSNIAVEPFSPPQERRIVVNSTLAADLGISEGDAVLLTLGREQDAPADSIFMRRSRAQTTRTLRLVVGRIIPSRGIGAFSLRQESSPPRNLYVALDWLQAQLKQPAQANAILIGRRAAQAAAEGQAAALADALAASWRLTDCGLRLRPDPEFGYLALQSGQIVLPPAAVARAEHIAGEFGMSYRPSSIYLVTTLERMVPETHEAAIHYCLVAGLDPRAAPAGPLPMAGGGAPPALGKNDILLNAWAAQALGARVGDSIGPWKAQVRGIVAMEGAALDQGLVPEFEGITDAVSIADWDLPFAIDAKLITPADEAYWRQYRTVPKAFLPLDVVRSFWPGAQESAAASPYGGLTSVALVPPEGMSLKAAAECFESAFRRGLASDFGLAVQPVRAQALATAKGTTDFGVIFLSMSFFLVAAAAGMVGLLLRLAVERRASQFGIMSATGFTARSAARVLVGEGFLLGAAGVLLGVPAGIGYAWLIIRALRTRWAGAVGDLSLTLHVTPLSLAIGAVAGFLVSAAAVIWAARLLRLTPTLRLLAGWRAMAAQPQRRIRRRALGIGIAALVLAAGLLACGLLATGSAEGAFLGGGACLLAGFLALACAGFQRAERAPAEKVSLWRLGWRGASRDWVRSLLTAGLIACASFIIVVVAANRKDLSRANTAELRSGAGGFSLLARSDVPIMTDLNTAAGREALGLPPETAGKLARTKFLSFRMTAGDDASCLNIQQPAQPRVLGVPHELVERGGFSFTAPQQGSANPWALLESDEHSDAPIPAFADATSAEWVLHVGLGDEVRVTDSSGKPVRLKIVGLLADSVFQGELLISDAQFRRHFADRPGYRFFLVETPPGQEAAVAKALRENLGELGFDVRRTADVLAGYARVQNTYLATFETLGGLGLLLGTFGIVTVLLRSVVERRGELAMLLALGLRRRQVVAMIVIEHGILLLLGLAVGSSAALVAVVPHAVSALADVNWLSLGGMLSACLIAGLLSCAFAAAVSVRGELLPSLRS